MKSLSRAGAIVLSTFLFAISLHAQATRTWVSGVGDDVNPCSRTAPCKTFAGAISKTAAGGEIDALDPAGFGAVNITKSITLDGGGGQVASILVSSGNAITINAGSTDVVTIRNLSINGLSGVGSSSSLNGINVTSAGTVHVEHCNIFAFTSNGINFQPPTGALTVVDTKIRNNAGSGISVTGYATFTNTVLSANGTGLSVNSGGSVWVTNSTVSANTAGGISVTSGSSAAAMVLTSSAVVLNGGAGVKVTRGSASSTATLSGNNIVGNAAALSAVSGGVITSYGNNAISGSGAPTSTLPLQ